MTSTESHSPTFSSSSCSSTSQNSPNSRFGSGRGTINILHLVWHQRLGGGPRGHLGPQSSFSNPLYPGFRERRRKYFVSSVDATQQRQYEETIRDISERRSERQQRRTNENTQGGETGGSTNNGNNNNTSNHGRAQANTTENDEEEEGDDDSFPDKLPLHRIDNVASVCFACLRVFEEFISSPDLNIQKGLRKAALGLQKVFAQKVRDEDVNGLTTHFSSLRGPAIVLEVLNKIDWILQNVDRVHPDEIIVLCGTANGTYHEHFWRNGEREYRFLNEHADLLTLLRELSFLRKIINQTWMRHRRILALIVSFLRYPDTFDSAVICLEEAIAACGPHGVPRMLEIEDFADIIRSLEPRRLAKVCRVVALLIFEPEVHDIDDPFPAVDILNRFRKEQLEEEDANIPPCACKALQDETYKNVIGIRKKSKNKKKSSFEQATNTRDRYQIDRKKQGGNEERYVRKVIQENQRTLLSLESILSRLVEILRLKPRFSGTKEDEPTRRNTLMDQFLNHFSPNNRDDLHGLINTVITQLAEANGSENSGNSQEEALAALSEISGCSTEIKAEEIESAWQSDFDNLEYLGKFHSTSFCFTGTFSQLRHRGHKSPYRTHTSNHGLTLEANALSPGLVEDFPPSSLNSRGTIRSLTTPRTSNADIRGLCSAFESALSSPRPTENQEELVFNPPSWMVRTSRIHELNICISILCALDSSDRNVVIREILALVCCNSAQGLALSLVVSALLSGIRGRGPMRYSQWRKAGETEAIRDGLSCVAKQQLTECNVADVAEAFGIPIDQRYCGHLLPSCRRRSRVNLLDPELAYQGATFDNKYEKNRRPHCFRFPFSEPEAWHTHYKLRHLLSTVGSTIPDINELRNENCYHHCQKLSLTEHPMHMTVGLSLYTFSLRNHPGKLLCNYKPWTVMNECLQMEKPQGSSGISSSTSTELPGNEISYDEKAIFSAEDCLPALRNTRVTCKANTNKEDSSADKAPRESEELRRRYEHQVDRRLRRLHFRKKAKLNVREGLSFVKLEDGLGGSSTSSSRIPAEESSYDSDYNSDDETDNKRRMGLRGSQLHRDVLHRDNDNSPRYSLSVIFRQLCPDAPHGLREANRISNNVLESAIAAHQVEVIVTLCGLLNGRTRKAVQDNLADAGIVQAASTLLEHTSFSWTDRPPDWEPPRLHGENCTCDPESSNKIQVLRLLHSLVDRGESRTAFERWITRRRTFSVRELLFFEKEESHAAAAYKKDDEGLRHGALLSTIKTIFTRLSDGEQGQLLDHINQHMNRPMFARNLSLSVKTEEGKRMAIDSAIAVALEILLRPWELGEITAQSQEVIGEDDEAINSVAQEKLSGIRPPRALGVPVGIGVSCMIPLGSNPLNVVVSNRPGLRDTSLEELIESNLGHSALWLTSSSLQLASPPIDQSLPRQAPGCLPESTAIQPLRSVYCPIVTCADAGMDLNTTTNLSSPKLASSSATMEYILNKIGGGKDEDNLASQLLNYDLCKYKQAEYGLGGSVASQIIRLLVSCSFKSPYRFWLSSCTESLLRNSPVSVRKWATRYGLVKYLTLSIEHLDCERRRRKRNEDTTEDTTDENTMCAGFYVFDDFLDTGILDIAGNESQLGSSENPCACSPERNVEIRTFQSAFDLLAEAVKMNPCALEDMEDGLNGLSKTQRTRFLRTLCQRPVDSTVFLRSVLLTMHWCRKSESANDELPQFYSIVDCIPNHENLCDRFRRCGRWVHESIATTVSVPAEEMPEWAMFSIPIADGCAELPHTYNKRGEFIIDTDKLEDPCGSLPPICADRVFHSEICSFLHAWAIPILFNVMEVIKSVESINQENLCCLNTAVLYFIVAHKQGKLPGFIRELWKFAKSPCPIPYSQEWYNECLENNETVEYDDAKREGVEDKTGVLSTFGELLEFWLHYYAARWKDRPTLALTTGFHYLECRETVMILLNKYEEFEREIQNEFKEEYNTVKHAQCCVAKDIMREFCHRPSAEYIQNSKLF